MTATYPLGRPSAFAANSTNPLSTLDTDLVNITDTLNSLGNGVSTLNTVTIGTGNVTTQYIANVTITNPFNLPGTTINNNATAGSVGEYVQGKVDSGSQIALSNGVVTNVTSITITSGDWQVSATALFTGNATTTIQYFLASIGNVSATVNSSTGSRGDVFYSSGTGPTVFSNGNFPLISLSPVRYSASQNTTVYLVVQSGFATGTCNAYGVLNAIRTR